MCAQTGMTEVMAGRVFTGVSYLCGSSCQVKSLMFIAAETRRRRDGEEQGSCRVDLPFT